MNDPEFRHLVNTRPTPQSDAIVTRLAPLTPGLSEAERIYRVACGMLLILFGTGNGGLVEWVGNQVETTQSQLLLMLTDAVTSVLSGGAGAERTTPSRDATGHDRKPPSDINPAVGTSSED
jgi:hypothetical protein